MVASLATPQGALDALDLDRRLFVTIGGVPTEVISYSGQHGARQRTATGRLTLALPRPAHIVSNAVVEVQSGYNDLVGTVFSGFIPAWTGSLTQRGALLTARAVGWKTLLAEELRFDLTYQGPIGLRDLFVSLCAYCGVPRYRAAETTGPDGTPILLGGNPRIDNGRVTVPASQGPLAFLEAVAEPLGYAVIDATDGTVSLQRLSGRPPGGPVVTFIEGVSLLEVERDHDVSGKVNWWDVRGPTYADALGAAVPIRSFPASVPYDPEILPDGVRYRDYTNSLLVTQALADTARAVKEMNTSAADTPVRWHGIGLPGISPGDAVEVESPTVEAAGPLWLLEMDVTDDERGCTARYSGWAGGGVALPGGQDRQRIPIQAEATHLGDETVPWYDHPAPQGAERSWTLTIPERATAVNVRFWHHGSNSQYVGGRAADDLDVSRWELWRPGEGRARSSGVIAPVPENYTARLPYGDGLKHWTEGAVGLRGIDAGEVTLRLIAGRNAGLDDFEVRDIELEWYGTAEPVLPMEGSAS